MKSTTRKFSGRARAAFERQRQDRLWMEDRIDEYFEPSAPDPSMHVAPVRMMPSALLEAPAQEADDSGCDWGSFSQEDMQEADSSEITSVAFSEPTMRGEKGLKQAEAVPVIRPARLSRAVTGVVDGATTTPTFRWSWFLLACAGGMAAGLAFVWLVFSLLG